MDALTRTAGETTPLDATLPAMHPAVRAPSAEALALARRLLADPDATLSAADPLLQHAARRVAHGLDAYDRQLIARRAEDLPESPSRRALEQALARRIASAQLALAEEMATRPEGARDRPAGS
jgi:hypothetical protein